MQMAEQLKRIGFFVWPVVLALPHILFLNVVKSAEPTLFAQGHPSLWWSIVLLYWLIDTAVVFGLVACYRWPIFPRRPDVMSILVLVGEISLITLLFHLSLLVRDHAVRGALETIGLRGLPQFFLAIMSLWMLIVFVKYERWNKVDDDAKARKTPGIKWPTGRRTSVTGNSSHVPHRYRPK